MPREHLAHGLDELLFRHGKLRRTALAPFFMRCDPRCSLRPFDEILDLHFAARLLVAALNHHAGRAAAIGIFELRPHLAASEAKLRANAGGAQPRYLVRIGGEACRIEPRPPPGPGGAWGGKLAEVWGRGRDPRHADGESGCRHGLPAKAGHEPVIAAAAAHRAETHRAALLRCIGGGRGWESTTIKPAPRRFDRPTTPTARGPNGMSTDRERPHDTLGVSS